MNRRAVWPDFRDAWILHDDGDVIAIDKPAGVPSQAPDPDRPDDVVTRLARHLGGAYLGIHQRLDRDTSGVLLYARRKEANRSLAAQFENRRVKKTYLAAVEGWPAGRGRARLVDALVEGKDGTARVASGRHPGAKKAVTDVRVVARRGTRALLELGLETGRMHQARAQLAHAGAPIAGDVLYGGARAPRLMLHASRLELVHPIRDVPLRVEAPAPPELRDWLERGDPGEGPYDDEGALRRALERGLERRWGLGRGDEGPRATTAFRLINEEGDGLPRLAVDVYGDWLVAQLYGTDGPWADGPRRERVLDALHALGFDGVYLKIRPKQANTLVDTRRDDLAPSSPVRGAPAPGELTVREEGLPLHARLGDGLSTGIFLDQRGNRARVRAMAAGKSVANLFAYTCAFTSAAVLGGATRTVSVDASAAALERGRANLALLGPIDDAAHRFVADDAFAWLARTAKRETFDLVLVDPPSYSTTRARRFTAEGDYAELAAAAYAVVARSGSALFCTNHRGITPGRFRKMLHDGARAAGRTVGQMRDLPEGGDFPSPPAQWPATKCVLVTLAT